MQSNTVVPDSGGQVVDENVAIGMRRLSIIDVHEGKQPIYNEDKSKVITFNGEIYNFQKLREALVAADTNLQRILIRKSSFTGMKNTEQTF